METLLENSVSREGLRTIHIMGNAPVSSKWMDYVPDCVKNPVVRKWEDEIHLHHLLVNWQSQEIVRWTFQTQSYPEQRNVALWFIQIGQKASQAILDAAVCYALNLGHDPLFAFIQKIPTGAEDGVEVKGIMLIQADWVPTSFVLLDSGGTQKLPEYRVILPQEGLLGQTVGQQLKLSV